MSAPVVSLVAGTSSAPAAATLSATVNPEGLATTLYFRWGATEDARGTSSGITTTVVLGSGMGDVVASSDVVGMIPGVTYTILAVATNSDGTTYGTGTVTVYAPPFTAILAESTSPWNDPRGAWAGYNAAFGSIVESTYDIVADLGDPEQPHIGLLSVPIAGGTTVTEIDTIPLALPLPANATVAVVSRLAYEVFAVSVRAPTGATAISVLPRVTDDDLEIGTPIVSGYSPGWSSLLHTEQCPDEFLPFLAQFTGADVPRGLNADTARQRIRGESAQHRGTLGAITAAIRENLSGTKFVSLLERVEVSGNPNAYWFLVVVRTSEVVNVAALTAAVNAIKPGGVMWTLIETDLWIISQMEAFAASITELEGDFSSVTKLELDLPT